jgi:hypothetical protein
MAERALYLDVVPKRKIRALAVSGTPANKFLSISFTNCYTAVYANALRDINSKIRCVNIRMVLITLTHKGLQHFSSLHGADLTTRV